MTLSEKILKEANEDILDSKIKNPETGHDIKVSSALTYDDTEVVKKKAVELIKRSAKNRTAPESDTKTKQKTSEPKKNSRSHKKAGRQFGVNKEIKDLLKKKGFPMLTAFPQTFVKPDELVFNPKLNDKNKDSVWVLKFPALDKFDRVVTKTVYTPGFMLKSKVKNFKKISKIKTSDIETFEEKTKKLLTSKNAEIADAACVIRIILKTGLRIGSQDNPDTGSIGTRTLQVKNLTLQGSKIRFDFIGKSAQQNIAELDDVEVADYLNKAIKGKKPDDRIFNVSYEQTSKIMSKINPKGINPKDLRAYKATETAKMLARSKEFGPPPPLSKDKKILKKQVKDKLKKMFDKVSQVLNNTPSMARNSYIHPVVITDWLDSLGLTPKEVAYKHVMVKDSVLFPEEKKLIESLTEVFSIVKSKKIKELFESSLLKIFELKTKKKFKSLNEVEKYLREFISNEQDQFEKVFRQAVDGNYEDFVKKLKSWAEDPKVNEFLKSGLNDGTKSDDKFSVSSGSILCSQLIPTQSEIDLNKSLDYPLKNPELIKKYLNGNDVEIFSPIITFNGRYIIDGHHRWSQVYCINPNAKMKVINFKKSGIGVEDMLKATQIAIAATTESVPTEIVEGSNLFNIFPLDIMNYIIKNISEGSASLLGNNKNQAAKVIALNCQKMQKNNKPIKNAPPRGFMPQTNLPDGNINNIIKILSTGSAQILPPFEKTTNSDPITESKLNEAEEIHWTTMDEMFEKFADYGEGIDYSDISDEDSYDCEEYPIPDWYFDDNWELLPI